MTKRFIVSVFLSCFLLSCTNKVGEWYKQGSTEEEYKKVRYMCLKESQQQHSEHSLGYGKSDVVTNGMLFDACMESHEFRWRIKSL